MGEDKAFDKVRYGEHKQYTMLETPPNDYYYLIENIKIHKLY